MKAPNLFILGAQKAGTTYLGKAFSHHPEIFFSEPKELLFFHKPGLTRKDYRTYLLDYFAEAEDQPWRGEGSTTYLQWPEALPQIKRFVPGRPKFIVCLRQQTEKSVSFFIHNWRRDRYAPGQTITETVPMPIAFSPLMTGLYAPSIKRWLAEYPREDFLFLNFDWLREDPGKFVTAATDFLGVAPTTDIPDKLVNAGLPLVWEDDVLTIAKTPEPGQVKPVFTPEELHEIHAMFQDDITKTEDLTGLDLSAWREMPKFG
ncbi:sulfotransferase (plasmid) [Dinoroseobacter shibae DFL 12 = DSM 16493]|jgi:hypothetical protein|uniref:Sulfotransferase n=1 Tax=Dinoroseobacter shibae (strain DSM 16493 / NCIMB 14021 / DFL 12) TaxID=398580 RepID=A8LTM5_DINSH|nr:sulfotransferase domain-containing protein [Dinoroseobacter shibae]ABV95592.1 sulfotransferase [Dinoroseobacter shibae DFL 12 = DSM 16493]URF48933.1 sulfotransferase domain-containing protein [Dinoroseobacter shibae]URF53245.1 sulfotransferase domain-containing protein [Dinoroseobacter shibae]